MTKNTEFVDLNLDLQRLILLEAIGCDAKGRVNLKDILKLGLVSKQFLSQLDQLFKFPQLRVNVDIDSEETLDSFLKFKNIHPEWKFYTKLCFKDITNDNMDNAFDCDFNSVAPKDLTAIIDKYADFNEIDLTNVNSITEQSLEKIAEKCQKLERLVLGSVCNHNQEAPIIRLPRSNSKTPLSLTMIKILERCKELKELDISKSDWIDVDIIYSIKQSQYPNLDLTKCKIDSDIQVSLSSSQFWSARGINNLAPIPEDPDEGLWLF